MLFESDGRKAQNFSNDEEGMAIEDVDIYEEDEYDDDDDLSRDMQDLNIKSDQGVVVSAQP
jgi:hypothetical protein